MLYENDSCCCDQNKTPKMAPACCALCSLDRVHCLYRDLGDGEIITLIDSNLRRFKEPGMTLEIFEEIYCKDAKPLFLLNQ